MQLDVGRILNTLRDRQLVPDTCQAVYVVGSGARGWSNKRSDIDLCLVSTEPWSVPESIAVSVPLRPATVEWYTFHADNHGWDLAYWTDAQVDQALAKVSWAEYDQVRATSDDVLAPREEVFIGRITTCVPVVGEDWLARRRAEIETSAFRSIVVTRSLGSANMAIEDALGQLENGDVHSAVLSTRRAFEHTVDALLEERGQYESNIPKWQARRFMAANPSALSFAEYWDIETMRGLDPDDSSTWIREVLTLCQDLSLKIAV